MYPFLHHVDNHLFFTPDLHNAPIDIFINVNEALLDRLSIYLLCTIMYLAILLFIL